MLCPTTGTNAPGIMKFKILVSPSVVINNIFFHNISPFGIYCARAWPSKLYSKKNIISSKIFSTTGHGLDKMSITR